MSFGDRLKSARKAKNLDRMDLAKLLDMPYTTYVNYETDQREPKHSVLVKLSEQLSVSIDYLLGRIENTNISKQIHSIRVPVLGRVPAGTPLEAIEDIIYWEELSPYEYSAHHDYFGLLVFGDSMSPKYIVGDIVIVQKSEDADFGKDVIAYVNGHDATLKRIIKNTNGSIELVPINPAYPTLRFTANEVEDLPVKVVGVVKEIRRKV